MSLFLSLVAVALAQIQSFGGTEVYQLSNSAFYWTGKLDVDADGSARAYGPGNSGIDYTANAGGPGNWYGVYAPGGTPLVQGSGDPQPGFYVSTTSLVSNSASVSSPCHYVDAEKVSFTVLPGSSSFRANAGFAIGDFGVAYYASTGKLAYFIYGDAGPSSQIGEGSVQLVTALGFSPWNSAHSKVVAGPGSGVTQVVFPQSGFGQGHVPTNNDINVHAAGAFAYYGGCSMLANIVGSSISGCSHTAPNVPNNGYDCQGSYGVQQTCGASGACASAAVCGGWGGTIDASVTTCSGASTIGCCTVNGYGGASPPQGTDAPTPQQGSAPTPSPAISCSYGANSGTCVTQAQCTSGTWTSSNNGATGCEQQPSNVRCCWTPANGGGGGGGAVTNAPAISGGPSCTYHTHSGACVAVSSCHGQHGQAFSSRAGANGCQQYAANVQCCIATASLLVGEMGDVLSSSAAAWRVGAAALLALAPLALL